MPAVHAPYPTKVNVTAVHVALSCRTPTAPTHVASVLLKLGLRNRVQAVIYLYESGLLRPGAPDRGTT